ncbi:hypothetical protein DL89DRAFT_266715 [Linderina pennispora]|uniref:Uncharacterized protein n=1 Tax=Linderina pennispora TaxID=61395 RepID=A0A1Y1WAN2_9FUNG|nr:uncharacterized protein DL89DRAFT_266715 [Linderina pennispora]ORX70502.1 hypothetical protein DL89DRAFT_266715 [Linderina pennispora]
MATYVQPGSTPYFTQEQIDEMRAEQHKNAKKRLAYGLTTSIIGFLVSVGFLGYYLSQYFGTRGRIYYRGRYSYRYNETYFTTRAGISGAAAGIGLICIICVIVSYKKTMRILNDPSAPWLQAVQNPNTSTTHFATKPEFQNQPYPQPNQPYPQPNQSYPQPDQQYAYPAPQVQQGQEQYTPPNHPPPAQMKMPNA